MSSTPRPAPGITVVAWAMQLAWFIHFVQDVLIFSFLALGATTPGGR